MSGAAVPEGSGRAGGWVARSVRAPRGPCGFDPVRLYGHAGCLAAVKLHGDGGSEAKKKKRKGVGEDEACVTVSPSASVGDGRKPARRSAQTALGVRGHCPGEAGALRARAEVGNWGCVLTGTSGTDGHSRGLEILSVSPLLFLNQKQKLLVYVLLLFLGNHGHPSAK